MAAEKVNNYGIGDIDFTALMQTVDALIVGNRQVMITEYDTTAEPLIAAGSRFEVGGALYKWDSNEPIYDEDSNGFVNGDLYIKCIPAGDTLEVVFTNTAPVWSNAKQGWYGIGDNAGHKYLPFMMTFNTTTYEDKRDLPIDNNSGFRFYADGSFDLTSVATFTWNSVTTRLTFAKHFAAETLVGAKRASGGTFDSTDTENYVFDGIVNFLGTTLIAGQVFLATGMFGTGEIISIFIDSTSQFTINHGLSGAKIIRDGNGTAIGSDMRIYF
jgi:hypothetical protein